MQAHPDSPYKVLEYTPSGMSSQLPPGYGGIAVLAWYPRQRDYRNLSAPIIGVDGQPAFESWGHALIPVPAGRRLVEVQDTMSRRSLMVTVAEGQVVELDYVPPQAMGSGLLGPSPQRPLGYKLTIAMLLGVSLLGFGIAIYQAVMYAGGREMGLLVVAILMLCVGVGAALAAKFKLGERTKRRAG